MSKIKQIFFSFLILGLMSGFIFHSSVYAQIDVATPYWEIMPPYNVLWPLSPPIHVGWLPRISSPKISVSALLLIRTVIAGVA